MTSLFALLFSFFLTDAPLPTPESVTGVSVGSPHVLVSEGGILDYLRAVDAASPRVLVREIGKSTEGRPLVAAFVSSEENLAHLDRLQEIQRRLADPRGLDAKEEDRLIGEGRAVAVVAASIHSDEVGGTQAAVRIVDRLARGATPREREILDQVVTIVIPVQNPDGYAAVTDWYLPKVGGPFERSPLPVLYQRYAGHDINRDWFRLALRETRACVESVYRPWHPQAILDLHQMQKNGPRFFLPPFMDPVDPDVDPMLRDLGASCGAAVAAELDEAGLSGVVTGTLFDAWSPSRSYAPYHNAVRFLFEAAGTDYASPVTIGRRKLTFEAQSPSSRMPKPWPGGEWGLGDVVRYHETTTIATLDRIASQREEWLRRFVAAGRRASEAKPPYAFVFPLEQHDAGALRDLLGILSEGDVEVCEAAEAFEIGEQRFGPGTPIVRTAQPYGSLARTLLLPKRYPSICDADGVLRRPYDTTAHELPALMGVRCVAAESPLNVKTRPLSDSRAVDSFASDAVGTFVLPAERNDSVAAVNRLLAHGVEVRRAPHATTMDGRTYAAGAWIARGPRDRIAEAARAAGADARETAESVADAIVVRAPRIGIYRSFVPSSDFGWTCFVLEQAGFEFESLTNADFRAASAGSSLRSRFDAIVFADQAPSEIADGWARGSMPPDFCGGLGDEGARELREFASAGGTVVTLGSASSWATWALGLPARNVLADADPTEFDAPGSILRIVVDTDRPLGWGMPRETFAIVDGSEAFDARGGDACVRFASKDVLRSGWLVGERRIADRAGVLDVPVDRGRVILFGIRPQFRAQAGGTYKLFFNALWLASPPSEPSPVAVHAASSSAPRTGAR
jgi:zinc carboxypeptidase